jgi:hypothetical protein
MYEARWNGVMKRKMTETSMTEAELTKAVNRLDKRLDWIEESLGRVVGLQYVPMGRSDTRPDAAGVPAEVVELARVGKTMEAVARYRELTGVDFVHARQVIDSL